jgi:hypothetical protein
VHVAVQPLQLGPGGGAAPGHHAHPVPVLPAEHLVR